MPTLNRTAKAENIKIRKTDMRSLNANNLTQSREKKQKHCKQSRSKLHHYLILSHAFVDGPFPLGLAGTDAAPFLTGVGVELLTGAGVELLTGTGLFTGAGAGVELRTGVALLTGGEAFMA